MGRWELVGGGVVPDAVGGLYGDAGGEQVGQAGQVREQLAQGGGGQAGVGPGKVQPSHAGEATELQGTDCREEEGEGVRRRRARRRT